MNAETEGARGLYGFEGLLTGARDFPPSVLRPYGDRMDRVTLSGSRATGAVRPNSDIGIALHGVLSPADVDPIWTLMDDGPHPVTVDIVACDESSCAPLKQHIDLVGQPRFTKRDLLSAA